MRLDDSERAFLAFKLHRVVCGAGHVYTTLRAHGRRNVTLEGQRFDPADANVGSARRGLVLFTAPMCHGCTEWAAALGEASIPFAEIDIRARPDLADKYAIGAAPVLLSVRLPLGRVERGWRGAPTALAVHQVRDLSGVR